MVKHKKKQLKKYYVSYGNQAIKLNLTKIQANKLLRKEKKKLKVGVVF